MLGCCCCTAAGGAAEAKTGGWTGSAADVTAGGTGSWLFATGAATASATMQKAEGRNGERRVRKPGSKDDMQTTQQRISQVGKKSPGAG